MTSEQFVYWLQGFLEVSGAKEISPEQLNIVRDHLALVFNKVTPSYTITDNNTITVPAIGPYLGGKVEVICSSVTDGVTDTAESRVGTYSGISNIKYCKKIG